MARADVRPRIRPSVVRVRVNEAAIRTVVRITAPQQQSILPLPVLMILFHRRMNIFKNRLLRA